MHYSLLREKQRLLLAGRPNQTLCTEVLESKPCDARLINVRYYQIKGFGGDSQGWAEK